ncbi:MAG TPA: BTAD domain-containing putative transcriptional regulator, partial [Gemmatimonadaceae bacterium]|nr:BTAD domain-containing putative transcriptional regulator [Gemmatimonadaceae bacterium]
MIEFRTLGRVDVRDPSRAEAREILSQPKRLALLAYIAMHPGVRRDTLVALFWPELDQEHARGALRQALRQLRRALGEAGAELLTEEHLEIPASLLRCDAAEFARACDEGRAADVLALYGGDFLEGIHVEGSPAFEDWLDATRARLRQCAARAAWSAHEVALAVGDAGRAAGHARRAVELAPYDEASLRRLLRLLDQLGDRAAAAEAYERFAERLERELEVKPSAETRELVAAIRAREAARVVEPLAVTGLAEGAAPRAAARPRSR